MKQAVEWPEVTVVVCTYDRPQEVRQTLESHLNNLKYPIDRVRWHIADDGTKGGYAKDVVHWLEKVAGVSATCTITQRRGWGANVNTALKAVQSEYVYFTEDDYLLLRPLDLRPYVALMAKYIQVGLVRFGIAGHNLTCHLREADIHEWLPEFQENSSNQGYSGAGKLALWEVDRKLSEGPFSFYKYSNRPHLKNRSFHDTYGYYQEGLALGQTEHAMNHQIAEYDRGNAPMIVCPADWVLWHYDHIGESRQGSAAELEVMYAAH